MPWVIKMLICPKCKGKLNRIGNTLICDNKHCFDFSKEGYVNLLLGSKSGDKKGDSKDSARARHEFLSKDYYISLKNAITERMNGVVLDICCGEGYYDDYSGELYGFDISKEMVRLASKRHKDNKYFVANLSSIPISNKTVDTAVHLFAPFNENEFSRILKDDGVLYSVIPGENHLFELKEILYETPYKNDEEPPKSDALKLISKTKITDTVSINQADLKELFSMTPYFYHTADKDKAKLDEVGEIKLTVEFIILEYRK